MPDDNELREGVTLRDMEATEEQVRDIDDNVLAARALRPAPPRKRRIKTTALLLISAMVIGHLYGDWFIVRTAPVVNPVRGVVTAVVTPVGTVVSNLINDVWFAGEQQDLVNRCNGMDMPTATMPPDIREDCDIVRSAAQLNKLRTRGETPEWDRTRNRIKAWLENVRRRSPQDLPITVTGDIKPST